MSKIENPRRRTHLPSTLGLAAGFVPIGPPPVRGSAGGPPKTLPVTVGGGTSPGLSLYEPAACDTLNFMFPTRIIADRAAPAFALTENSTSRL